jgi:hypothetical protein
MITLTKHLIHQFFISFVPKGTNLDASPRLMNFIILIYAFCTVQPFGIPLLPVGNDVIDGFLTNVPLLDI